MKYICVGWPEDLATALALAPIQTCELVHLRRSRGRPSTSETAKVLSILGDSPAADPFAKAGACFLGGENDLA
ncbi:MAG TPA: hypothetical protein VKU80_03250, partial [Planctomycetota bacterium]|nr:hypothetical protein [Planctomycetota bacterium]